MNRFAVGAGLVALLALPGCDLSAPVWNAEFFFPVDYPDIELSDYAVAGEIPDIDLAFSAPAVQQDITGLLEEMLSDDLVGLQVEVITETTVDVTGQLTLNIATSDSGAPALSQAGTRSPAATITVQHVAGLGTDTSVVIVDAVALRNAIALQYQTEGSLRGAPGGTPVSAGDRIRIEVNLLATYQMSR